MYNRSHYFVITLALLLIEILIATVFRHWRFIRESVGDMLVVVLIYFGLQSWRRFESALLARWIFYFACGVELVQAFHLVEWLGLAPGSVGGILLGNTFSWQDILMYAIGGWVAYVLDQRLNQTQSTNNKS